MAEQEAVAQVVSSAMDDRSHGESLLLPLLQELLDKKSQSNPAPQPLQRSASSQSSEESAPTVDSGTESGEELRFLAANLADGIEPLGPGLLAEVQGALSKLALSLQMDNNDMETDKRNSLLQLVARLQSSLVVAKPERRASSGGRFQRKNRQNRHTVGVSSEELAAARKLMEEVVLRDSFNPEYKLEKQNSDTSVTSNKSYSSINPSTPVKNNTAKPFSQSYSISEPSTPPVVLREFSSKSTTRQSSLNMEEVEKPPLEHVPSSYNHNQVENWVQNPSAQIQNSKTPEFNIIQESDDDASTVKQSDGTTPTNVHYITDVKAVSRTITPVNETIHENSDYYNDMSAAQRLLNLAMNDETKTNRFNTKKLKMKRANTIDIPKPLNFYENDDDSDDNILDRDETSTRRSNYLALRGPIRLGASQKSTVPSFEPKTENDKKFMAFIQKHNSNSSNVSSIWAKHTEPVKHTEPAKTDQNWHRKFGNIKTIFEKDEQSSRPPSTNSNNAAKQFWQSADDAVNAGKRSYMGPKVSKQGTRQLQSLFEQKQQDNKLPWSATEQNNVVTANLKLENSFKPIQNNNLIQGKNYKFVPQPLPVNKFDHAPMSAFKPPPKRTPLQTQSFSYPQKQIIKEDKTSEPTTPLYLYTPKQPEFPDHASSKPWISPNNNSEHRVLSIAASKFENARDVSPQPTRKLSKDKVYIPPVLTQENKDLNSPYLVKTVPSKTVRKMSGEYDHNWSNNKIENVVTYKQPVTNNSTKDKIQTVKQNVQKYEQKPQKEEIDKPKVSYKQNYSYEQPKSPYYPQENNKYQYSYQDNRNYTHDNNTKQHNYQDNRSYNNSHDTSKGYAQNNKSYVQEQKAVYNNNAKSYNNQKQQYSYSQDNQTPSYTYQDNYKYQQDNYNHYPSDSYHPDNQKPTKPHLIFDFPSSESSASRSVSTAATPDNLDESEPVSSPLTEYKAVAKVMTGPVSQQAVTVTQNTPKKREEHDLAARNLTSMLKFSMTEDKVEKKVESKPSKVSQESLEINDEGESVVTTKLQIPVSRNVYYNNTDPNKIQKRITMDEIEQINKRLSPIPPSKSPQPIHKSDSWHKLTESPTPNKPSPRASPKARNVLQKAKSSHTLAVPKQFEAGMAREEVETKKRSIAAYFGPAQQQAIIRKKTCEKVSTQTKGSSLSRSRTMPDVADLDPTDIDKEFERVFRQSISK